MKRLLSILITGLFALIAAACEDVIQVDLMSSEQRIVLEAMLDAETGLFGMHISKTASYYETNDFEAVPGAIVTLTTSTGNTYQCIDSGNGGYAAQNIVVNPGDTVNITIKTSENKLFHARTTVPVKATLTGLETEKQNGPFGNRGEAYQLYALWEDSAGVKNYYRLKLTVNDTSRTNQYFLLDDKIGDGETMRRQIFREPFQPGDVVTVELLSIDESYYEYFLQIADIQGSGFSAATPYNPMGNIDNDALGYFGIVYRSSKRIVIPT
ncbi:MAG: DUF4249 domain-containing protein [Bacteriovoracaceae bacterium]|nr:DUF4249 domain-containing protein [Bacteroidota bacterium]